MTRVYLFVDLALEMLRLNGLPVRAGQYRQDRRCELNMSARSDPQSDRFVGFAVFLVINGLGLQAG